MKVPRPILLFASVAFWGFSQVAALAQEPGSPEGPASGATPDESGAPASSDQGSLFPNAAPAPEQQPGARNRRQQSRLLGNKGQRNARATDLVSSQADADPLEIRVAYRRAKTKAMLLEPGLADLLQNAAAAPTDKIKRGYLRQYYATLFARVLKIDSSPALASHVALLQTVAKQRYAPQRRAVAGEEDLVNGRRGR